MITADDLVEDLIAEQPEAVRVFMDHNFPCLVCGEPVWGTIGENSDRYGLTPDQLDLLLAELNRIPTSGGS